MYVFYPQTVQWWNMAIPKYKVIQRIQFSTERSNINGISWSADNRLAVGTNGFVNVVSIKGVDFSDKKKGPKLKIARSIIAAETKLGDYDVGEYFSDTNDIVPMFSQSPCHSTAVIDPALSASILRHTGLLDIICAKWSPVGCDKSGRSVLAVLFRTNKLGLYVIEPNTNKWREIVDLSQRHCTQLNEEEYFKSNMGVRGKVTPDIRTKIGPKETWHEFKTWQSRKYLLNFTCLEWCPSPMTCTNKIEKSLTKFTFLATVVKSGNLLIWQGILHLVQSEHSVQRVLAAHTSLFYPCSLAWSPVKTDGSMDITKILFNK